MIAVFGATVLPFTANASSDSVAIEFDYVTVSPGQSMWDLASVYGAGQDPRDWIADAVALNNLESVELRAGQQIALP